MLRVAPSMMAFEGYFKTWCGYPALDMSLQVIGLFGHLERAFRVIRLVRKY